MNIYKEGAWKVICYIVDTLSGLFAVDESGNSINFIDFNDDNKKIIDFYKAIEDEIVPQELEHLLNELINSGFKEFIFDNKKIHSLLKKQEKYDSILNEYSPEFKSYRFNLEEHLKSIGIYKSQEDIALKHKNVSQELIKKQISQVGEQGDIAVIQIIETLDTLKKSISLFSARLREWYGLYFPELTDRILEDNILLAKLVDVIGLRKNYTGENLKDNFELNEKRVQFLIQSSSTSMGADFDLSLVQAYARQILTLDTFREDLESNLEGLMDDIAPNLKAIVGSLIGAKLITKAGGLKKLAYMPASRIQLLGAETALYRFLKTGKGIPKHGLIFQWNMIRGSKSHLRGKISRIVSGKIGLAAKIDYFKGDFIGNEISKDVMKKIKEIEEKYPIPPKKQQKVQKVQKNKPKKTRKGTNRGK
ncbi:MAG: hypothetical protein JW891_17965 [Candidatus Lokiarchaeota archaeon]|nr:hypothetical protein [Candidatus Lokiarchaeota archaeon]